MPEICEIAIIGAGPYGLSAAAYLRGAGRDVQVFGEPMGFWKQCMPKGMLLRSSSRASHISDPRNEFTLDGFARSRGMEWGRTVDLDSFVRYGSWFQRNAVPGIDGRRVVRIEPASNFRITTDDGATLLARRVVIATGLRGHEARPAEFERLPRELVSHSSAHADLASFRGREVAVIGAGQSAIESAALLHECGAKVEVIARASKVPWLRSAQVHNRRASAFLHSSSVALSPSSEVGPFPLNWLVHFPQLFRALSPALEERVSLRILQAAVASWLYSRTANVRIATGCSVKSADVSGTCVRMSLDDGSERCFDHVLLATGYRLDVRRLPFLSHSILNALQIAGGYPVLSDRLESSMPGLHFTGAAAVYSCGPLMQFVSGTRYSSLALVRGTSPNRQQAMMKG